MANHHRCINGTLQGAENYSAPVPVIGLFIAAASAVCALLMLYDIVIYGFIKKQRWLPCKWFKLNSVTLSFIGVVVKLTLDLTTSMPSALDQLSKLLGTTSLCIYMCYIFPSISDMNDSTNMLALSILVVTVFVNMCIQLSTGVVALFFHEHIVIMCIMLVLLGILWRFDFVAKNEKRDSVATGKSDFMVGNRETENIVTLNTFLQRLEVCYLHNYEANPQFRACRRKECGIIGDLSLISSVVLIQAAIRAIVLKKENLCTGMSSDYQWSMAMIVVIQFFFIVIGSFASFFRRCTMLYHITIGMDVQMLIERPYCSNPILKGKFSLVLAIEKVYSMIIFLHRALVFISVMLFSWFMSSMRTIFNRVFIMVKCNKSTGDEWVNNREGIDVEFKSIFKLFINVFNNNGHWVREKSSSSMKKLKEESRRKSCDLYELLSSIIPTCSPIEQLDLAFNFPGYQGVTQEIQLPPTRLHPLVVLVRLVEVAIPESPTQDRIVKTFREAFATLHFIEQHMHNTTLGDIKETEIAKAVWRAGDFSGLLPVNLKSPEQSPPPIDHAFRVMNCIYENMRSDGKDDDITANVKHIRDILIKRSYSSTEELGNFMQDLFAYQLNIMLAQLPDAIFKAVSQSSDDEFEERVRQSLKHFSMLQSWHGIHKWKLPQMNEICTLTGLVFKNTSIQLPSNPPIQDGVDGSDTGVQVLGKDVLLSGEHHVTIADDNGIVENQCI